MKIILTILVLLTAHFSWAQSNNKGNKVYSCNDSSFSWDQINIFENEDKLTINVNSGYNQVFTIGYFKPTRSSGNGQIIVPKNRCFKKGKHMACKNIDMDMTIRLGDLLNEEEQIVIDKTIKGSLSLSLVTKSSINNEGQLISNESGDLAVNIQEEDMDLRHFSIQVPCVREAFDQWELK